MLTDRVKDANGNESIPLSNADAEVLARLAKEGGFDPADWGLTTEELIKYKHILQQAFQAGLTAATISIVLKVAPEIIKAFQYLIETGELDKEQFQKVGFAALSGGAEGFVRGSVSAAITTACKAGLWGEAFKSVDPTIIGAVTVVAMDTMKNAYAVAVGKKTRREMADELVKEMYVSVCSLLVGSIMASELPVIGFMLGSFVGSVVGSVTYSVGYKMAISFCVDTGFTMFGLVEQDYTLPEDVMRHIGLDVFEYEHFDTPIFQPSKFEAPKFSSNRFTMDTVELVFLRRGVIGIRKIGYT